MNNMQTHKILGGVAALLIGAVTFTSCDNREFNDEPDKQPVTGGDIEFAIGFAPQTRVSTAADFISAWEDGDEIGVFAVADGQALSATASGNHIHNVKLTYSSADGGKWTTAASLYFKGAQMDFYAYYPYDEAATNPLNITFNVQADQSAAANYNRSDLLSASAVNVAKGTPVTLTFWHKLALVQVEVDPVYIDRNGDFSVTLRGCKAGGAFNMADGSLTFAADAQPQTVKMLRMEQPADADYATKYTYRALIPAQVVAQGTNLCLMEQNGQLFNTPALTAALGLEAGDAKLYNATLPATAIQTVFIPKGTFLMGSPANEPNRRDNETQHTVTLTKDFHISKYTVTFAQYDVFCDATSRTKPDDAGWGRGDRPVIYVSWDDAVAYCTWLSEQTGQTWKLPTEAQWEYACRGGQTTSLPFGIGDGTKLTHGMANFNTYFPYDLAKNGEYYDAASTGYLGKTSAVGSYVPNAWGLYDMHGNVWEWCLDMWDGSDNYLSLPATDPLRTTGEYSVFRGGKWGDSAWGCRSALRGGSYTNTAFYNVGFRIVLVP